MMEFWGTGFNGVSQLRGNQFVEINANLSVPYTGNCIRAGDTPLLARATATGGYRCYDR